MQATAEKIKALNEIISTQDDIIKAQRAIMNKDNEIIALLRALI